MNKDEIISEIARAQTALEKTNSPMLRRDYSKYLKKLKQKLENAGRR